MTPEGELYFVSLAGSYLGTLEWVHGVLSVMEIDPPTAGAGTRRVWSDSAGILWISEWDAGQVARFDPGSGEWQEWRLPGEGPQAYAVYLDERDDVWLSDFGANTLVRFDPDTEEFVSVPLPDPNADVRQIHGRPGEVWGAESGADTLVVVRTDCWEAGWRPEYLSVITRYLGLTGCLPPCRSWLVLSGGKIAADISLDKTRESTPRRRSCPFIATGA